MTTQREDLPPPAATCRHLGCVAKLAFSLCQIDEVGNLPFF